MEPTPAAVGGRRIGTAIAVIHDGETGGPRRAARPEPGGRDGRDEDETRRRLLGAADGGRGFAGPARRLDHAVPLVGLRRAREPEAPARTMQVGTPVWRPRR